MIVELENVKNYKKEKKEKYLKIIKQKQIMPYNHPLRNVKLIVFKKKSC